MRVRLLRLRNFGSYRECALEFPMGITGAIGRNGSGKTTLFEAIAWALYGEGRSESAEIRSAYADDSEPCEVELHFDVSGQAYELVRRLRKRGKVWQAEALLRWSGGVVEGAKPVTEQVRRILGMDQRVFFKSVFSRQKEVDALAGIQPKERERHFLTMLGIDRIEKAEKQIRAEGAAKESQIDGLRRIKKDRGQLQRERDELDYKLRRTQERIAEQERFVTVATEAVAQQEERVQALRRQERAHSARANKKELLTQRLEQLSKTIVRRQADLLECKNAAGRLESLKPLRVELAAAKKELERLRPLRDKHQQRAKLLRDLDAVRKKLQAMGPVESRFAAASEEVRRLEERVEETRAAVAALSGSISELTARAELTGADIEKLRQRRTQIDSLGDKGPCPTCTRPLGQEFGTVMSHLTEEMEALEARRDEDARKAQGLRAELAGAQELLQRQSEELKGARDTLASLNVQAGRYRELQQQTEESERQIAEIGAVEFDEKAYVHAERRVQELEHVESEAARLEAQALRTAAVQEEIDRAVEEERQTKDELAEVERELEKFGFEPEELQREEKQLRRMGDELKQRFDALGTTRKELGQCEAELKAKEKELEDERATAQAIEALQREVAELRVLEALMQRFRKEMTERIRPQISMRASHLLQRITGGLYAQIEIEADYMIRCYDASAARKLSWFSGGESDLINLCLRVAISEIVAERGGGRLNLLVLDEVFGSQDKKRRDEILRALKELSKDFQQILVITHDEELKNHLENVIEVTRPPGGPSHAALV